MRAVELTGGRSLKGEVYIQGSKNAALPVMAACVLCREEVCLHGCPDIEDIHVMSDILRHLGGSVIQQGDVITINMGQMSQYAIDAKAGGSMRSSVILAGALLGRVGMAVIPYPGGCTIGKRPINLHLEAFEQMNICVEERMEEIYCFTAQIKGKEITLPFPSVGATENIILAAVCAQGETVINNAAKEPEIADFCLFLKKMGARIRGEGTSRICITGVDQLHGVDYHIISDRIVAGTYMAAAIGTGGDVTVKNVGSHMLQSLLEVFVKTGSGLIIYPDCIRIIAPSFIQPADIVTGPYPGFPTDMQSQMMAVLTLASGESSVYESVFEDRFHIVPALCRMGAKVTVRNRCAHIDGVKQLHGVLASAEDLRGGAALVMAGLMAEGRTCVYGAEKIYRGYQDICRDFKQLGADIRLLQNEE